MKRVLVMLAVLSLLASGYSIGAEPRVTAKKRRLLYNLDGDSCLTLKAGRKEPSIITPDDLRTLAAELTQPGSQVDTLLVGVNAQVMYYPTKIGTMRGALSTDAERAKWPSQEQQRFKNVQRMFEAGIDPYAVLLAEAKKRGLEALLTFRMPASPSVETTHS